MPQPYIGEIRAVSWWFAPAGWVLCQGQLLQISDYSPLFSLIGTTYGGDGFTTFGLPDLQGRVPVHRQSTGYPLGLKAGAETVTLTDAQLPLHNHPFNASSANGGQKSPAGNVPAVLAVAGASAYNQDPPTAALAASSIAKAAGGNLPHDNVQPYLAINYIISLNGIYPTQG